MDFILRREAQKSNVEKHFSLRQVQQEILIAPGEKVRLDFRRHAFQTSARRILFLFHLLVQGYHRRRTVLLIDITQQGTQSVAVRLELDIFFHRVDKDAGLVNAGV